MKRCSILFIFVIVSLLSLIAVHAQDSDATPKPGSRADNECYAGGTMEGKCGGNGFHADGSSTPAEVEWAWKCGYYMARFNDGKISRSDVPSECGILLPPPSNPAIVTECVLYAGSTTECLTGNVLKEDIGSNGVFENTYYVIMSAIAGNGGACPAGTTYIGDVGNFTFQAAFYDMMIRHGYKNTDDFCKVP